MSSTISAGRLSFIDYLRGIAVLWMIEVHVIDICLHPQFKTGRFYEILDISNGFVAVAFIFCAGIGFQLAFDKKEADYRRFDSALWGYVRRLGHILLLAFWLHLPAFSAQRLLNATAIEWQRFLDCDVLQTIVFSSFFALLYSLSLNSARARTIATALMIGICFGSAWYILPMQMYSHYPNVFGAMISGVPVSKFPLIPYSGYFFSGMLAIRFFMRAKDQYKMALTILGISIAMVTLALALKDSSFDFPGAQDWWHYSAGHAAFRLGIVMAVLMLLYLGRAVFDGTKVGSMLVLCGQESLFMYIFHLFVVYGYIANYSLLGWAQHSWGWTENILTYLVISGLTYILCAAYHRFKKSQPQRASTVIRYVVIAAVVIFCCIPASLTLK